MRVGEALPRLMGYGRKGWGLHQAQASPGGESPQAQAATMPLERRS